MRKTSKYAAKTSKMENLFQIWQRIPIVRGTSSNMEPLYLYSNDAIFNKDFLDIILSLLFNRTD